MTTTVPASLAERIVRPGDPEYRLLRSTYVRVHSPAQVIRPRTAAEVATALAYARETGLPLAVRSGGHSLAGLSSNDGGVVLDLSSMNGVRVIDRARRLVRIQPGARWSRVASALARHGLALSSGDHGNVGVGGLATAGGIGWLVRRFGLTIDRMRSAEIVLADGTRNEIDPRHDPELFWGVRGAGWALGVVTAFTFEAVEISDVAVAQLELELDPGRHPLAAWDEYMRGAPRELTTVMMLFGGHGGATIGSLTAVYAGDDPAAAEKAFRPLTGIGVVRRADARLVPYRALVPTAHEHPNVGQMHSFVRNGYVDTLDDGIDTLVHELVAGSGALLQLRSLGGAVSDVDPDATAYAGRHQSAMVIGTVWSEPALARLDRDLAPLHRRMTGAYVNFDATRGREVLDLAYPPRTRARLRALKTRVDPDGVFAGLDG
ncbi:MAG TPA: FAD-dependent oxidoreductase [Streptosporangiales bacterium]